jgi:hypothetical protein
MNEPDLRNHLAPFPENTPEAIKKGKPSSEVKCWNALNEDGTLIHIEDAQRQVSYTCWFCEMPMIARMGENKAHHFAHKAKDSNHRCGGEGFRHLRVKSFVYDMLKNIHNKAFLYGTIDIVMEKAVEEYKPDILISSPEIEPFAIEISDTNPPSKDKIERWKDRMHVIDISKLEDGTIGNLRKLAGVLIPDLLNFNNLMQLIKESGTQLKDLKNDLNQKKENLEAHIKQEIRELHEKHQQTMKELSNHYISPVGKRKVRYEYEGEEEWRTPTLWSGTYRKLDTPMDSRTEYGVQIESDNTTPESGDLVIIKTKAGNFDIANLGDEIKIIKPRRSDIWIHIFKASEKRSDSVLKEFLKGILEN